MVERSDTERSLLTRVRWPDDLDPQLRKWLTRVQRSIAHLRSTMLIYSEQRNVGGDSAKKAGWRVNPVANTAYNERVASNDRTILYDALTLALDEFVEVREQVQKVMDSAAPTQAPPGSREKVEAMERRARAGFSIFVDGDAH